MVGGVLLQGSPMTMNHFRAKQIPKPLSRDKKLISSLPCSYLGKQCAADRTQFLVIMDPPQTWLLAFCRCKGGFSRVSQLSITSSGRFGKQGQRFSTLHVGREGGRETNTQKLATNGRRVRHTCTSTCQGQAPSSAAVPPTILSSTPFRPSMIGDRPHSWALEAQMPERKIFAGVYVRLCVCSQPDVVLKDDGARAG